MSHENNVNSMNEIIEKLELYLEDEPLTDETKELWEAIDAYRADRRKRYFGESDKTLNRLMTLVKNYLEIRVSNSTPDNTKVKEKTIPKPGIQLAWVNPSLKC